MCAYAGSLTRYAAVSHIVMLTYLRTVALNTPFFAFTMLADPSAAALCTRVFNGTVLAFYVFAVLSSLQLTRVAGAGRFAVFVGAHGRRVDILLAVRAVNCVHLL